MNTPLSRDELAARIASDIPEGSVVDLGIGAPTLVANFLPAALERTDERGVDVEALLDPANYTGRAARLVDEAAGEQP